jgi:hypothetical protein
VARGSPAVTVLPSVFANVAAVAGGVLMQAGCRPRPLWETKLKRGTNDVWITCWVPPCLSVGLLQVRPHAGSAPARQAPLQAAEILSPSPSSSAESWRFDAAIHAGLHGGRSRPDELLSGRRQCAERPARDPAREPAPRPVHLVYDKQSRLPLKLRAFGDLLVPRLRERVGQRSFSSRHVTRRGAWVTSCIQPVSLALLDCFDAW